MTDVLVNFVLDKSGSMHALRTSTVGGFNNFVAEQAALDGTALMSLTLFDTTFTVRYVAADMRQVEPLGTGDNAYAPSGGTALYDAVATTIQGTDAWLANHPFDGKVVCVIMTDGQENSSVMTSLAEVNRLIDEKTKAGWEFVFLGAGNSAWTEGQQFAAIPLRNRQYFGATGQAVDTAYAGTSASLIATRTTGSAFTGEAPPAP